MEDRNPILRLEEFIMLNNLGKSILAGFTMLIIVLGFMTMLMSGGWDTAWIGLIMVLIGFILVKKL